MGGSDWREAYAPRLFVEEAMMVMEVAGLFQADAPPVLAGHSFGGILAMLATVIAGERLRAAILIDARLRTRSAWGREAELASPHRIYPTHEEAAARFRLQPRQPERNSFILDALAKEALRRVEGGWSWRADPDLRRKTELGRNLTDLIPRALCPLMFVRGAQSTTASDDVWAEHQAAAAAGTIFVEIPDAHHHVMIDQPIALISVLRAFLAALV